MNRIDRLPDFDWSDRAKRQIETFGADLVKESNFAFAIGNVAVAGLIYVSFTEKPWFWFALARNVRFRDLIDLRRLQENIPPGSRTAVEAEDAVAIRFAKYYGFRETGGSFTHNNVDYVLMRKM